MWRSLFVVLMVFVLYFAGCSNRLNDGGGRFVSVSDPNFVKTVNEIDSIVSQIEDEHSIRVYYAKKPVFPWFMYGYKIAPKSDYEYVLKYLKMLQPELAKYPDGFLEKVQIERIVICKKVSTSWQSKCGLADPVQKTVFLCYPGLPYYDIPYLKKVVHHEIYHVMELTFNGLRHYRKDPAWVALNEDGFKYSKRKFRYGAGVSDPNKFYYPAEGFISQYAMTSPMEEKAEVYSTLFVESLNRCAYRWMEEDEVLRNKVGYMKEFLSQQCDEMTDDFWERLNSRDCTMPCSIGGVCEEIKHDERFTFSLGDGTIIELIAIAGDADEGPKWWRPNGEVFAEDPFMDIESGPCSFLQRFGPKAGIPKIPDKNKFKKYHFIYRTKRGKGARNSFNASSFSGGQFINMGGLVRNSDGWRVDGAGVYTCFFPKDTETGSFGIGMTPDEWETTATYDPRTKLTSGSDGSLMVDKCGMVKGKLKIDYSCASSGEELCSKDPNFPQAAERLVALDRKGKEHTANHTKSRLVDGVKEVSACFHCVKFRQVKEFRLQRSPFTWLSFKNISLKGDVISDVQVNVIKASDPMD